MFQFENPVLQRELLVNLRTSKSFAVLAAYQIVLAAVIFFAWPPEESSVDLSVRNQRNALLMDALFLSQFALTALIAPSFAASGISGEKERKTYEMLLASPIRPMSIALGKLAASLTHLAILVFSSLPIVMLCLPMGGVSIYEVFVQMLVVLVSMTTFCAISLACSSFFTRTAASLAISYLLIFILTGIALGVWYGLRNDGVSRLHFMLWGIPACSIAISIPLIHWIAARTMYPPDVGSEGVQVVDLEQEANDVVGLVLQRDAFPDRLLLSPSRVDLMPDRVNPVFDKEMRSEFIGQGTMMLRWVIQISMVVAIGLMATCVIIHPRYVGVYVCYVLLFNVLIGPVFSAGIVTSERERQTLELLLTTPFTAWQVWTGKLGAALRVSGVLTSFLLWPLACGIFLRFFSDYYLSLSTIIGYLAITAITSLTTSNLGLFFSTLFTKSNVSMIVCYLVVLGLFAIIPVVAILVPQFAATGNVGWLSFVASTSPFLVIFQLPLHVAEGGYVPPDAWVHFSVYVVFAMIVNVFAAIGGLMNLSAHGRLRGHTTN